MIDLTDRHEISLFCIRALTATARLDKAGAWALLPKRESPMIRLYLQRRISKNLCGVNEILHTRY